MGPFIALGCLAFSILCGASLLSDRVHRADVPEAADLRSFQATALSFPETEPKPLTALIHEDGALECLALNIYWEARSEPLEGQVSVAAVTLNRVADGRFPNGVCAVVRQGGQKRLNSCQFSWWCDGKSDIPEEAEAWQTSKALARRALFGELADPTAGALWYHANYVSPSWTSRMVQTAWIGRHIFYRSPSFQHYIQTASAEWREE